MKVRPTIRDDIPRLEGIVHETGLFPSELLPEMLGGFLNENPNGEVWLTCEADGAPVGLCFAAPEQFTGGAWNMLAIAVASSRRGTGVGGALVKGLEHILRHRGERVLIADTSGTDAFARTRDFYRKHGFTEEARIRDFWAAGDDKVVFWKSL